MIRPQSMQPYSEKQQGILSAEYSSLPLNRWHKPSTNSTSTTTITQICTWDLFLDVASWQVRVQHMDFGSLSVTARVWLPPFNRLCTFALLLPWCIVLRLWGYQHHSLCGGADVLSTPPLHSCATLLTQSLCRSVLTGMSPWFPSYEGPCGSHFLMNHLDLFL